MHVPLVAMAIGNSTAADLMWQHIENQILYAQLHIHFPFKTIDVVIYSDISYNHYLNQIIFEKDSEYQVFIFLNWVKFHPSYIYYN